MNLEENDLENLWSMPHISMPHISMPSSETVDKWVDRGARVASVAANTYKLATGSEEERSEAMSAAFAGGK